jgi:hypothetical protein
LFSNSRIHHSLDSIGLDSTKIDLAGAGLDSTKIDLAGGGDAMDAELSGNIPPNTVKGSFFLSTV